MVVKGRQGGGGWRGKRYTHTQREIERKIWATISFLVSDNSIGLMKDMGGQRVKEVMGQVYWRYKVRSIQRNHDELRFPGMGWFIY